MSAADAARAIAATLEAGELPAPIEAELAGRLLAAVAIAGSPDVDRAWGYVARALDACERALRETDGACEACGRPIPRGAGRCPRCLIA